MSDNPSSPDSIRAPARGKSRTGLVLGILAGGLVLCMAIGTGLYIERDKIPAIGNLFPTSTPEGVYFNSANLNFSLYYPPTWVYKEQGGLVTLTSSQEMMDATTFQSSGASINIVRDSSLASVLGLDAATSSPEAILGQIDDPRNPLGVFGGTGTEFEPLRSFTVAGNPSASAVYSYDPVPNAHWLRYTIVIVSQDAPILFEAFCAQSEWAKYRPIFDGVLASLHIQSMP